MRVQVALLLTTDVVSLLLVPQLGIVSEGFVQCIHGSLISLMLDHSTCAFVLHTLMTAPLPLDAQMGIHISLTALSASADPSYSNIYIYADYLAGLETPDNHLLLKVDQRPKHAVGAVLWGRDDLLFAASEGAGTGRHRAFAYGQVRSRRVLSYDFAGTGNDSGDAMALNVTRWFLSLSCLIKGG
jgi:hypothetical protein